MPKDPQTHWPLSPGTIFFKEVASQPTLRRAIDAGRIRKLATNIYSADLSTSADDLILRNRFTILAHLLPDAVLVDRTAARNGLPSEGTLFVASKLRTATVALPGLNIVVRTGAPLNGTVPDPLWSDNLHIASPARIVVDNLATSRSRSTVARTLSLDELEEWLGRKLIDWGDPRLQHLRSEAHVVADDLDLPDRHDKIEAAFATIRNTGPARRTSPDLVKAIRGGRAWDPKRSAMFEKLADALVVAPEGAWDEPNWLDEPAVIGEMPFWESYLSNYIEGTIFTVQEARVIIDSRRVPATRPADGHDILGTYLCVADPIGRAASSDDPEELIHLLRVRHAAMLEKRPDIGPGKWKVGNNRAGSYEFVDRELVEGTLRRGLALSVQMPRGFRRAIHLMFVISETHPFTDGNGRSARMMANAELSSVRQSRILVPIVLRSEYMTGLRRLSLSDDLTAFCRVMAYAWRWSSAMPWEDRLACEGKMVQTRALIDSTDASETGVQLELP